MYAYVRLRKSIYLIWTYKSDKTGGTSTALRFLPEPIKNGTLDGVYLVQNRYEVVSLASFTNAIERIDYARLAHEFHFTL